MANTNYPSSETAQTGSTSASTANGRGKNITIGVLAAALLGTWGYYLYDKSNTTKQIEYKTVAVNTAMSSRDSVQSLYDNTLVRLDSLTGNNNTIKGQLSDKESEINKLRSEISKILGNSKATQADLARAKGLIATLNSKLATLEADNARLNGENQELTATNTHLSEEKQTLETNLQTTTAQKEELASTLDVASTFTASNIQITPVDERRNGKEKVTTKAKHVDKLVVSFDVENRVAKSGPADMYVIVTAPDGKVISQPSLGSATLTTRNDGEKPFTYKTTVDYQTGVRKSVNIPLREDNFQTGNYKIEVYQNGFKIAEGIRALKKGGLFS